MSDKELVKELDQNLRASRTQKDKRVEMWRQIEDFQTADHWNVKWHQLIQHEDRVYPSVQLSWMITDQMMAKIFSRDLKPIITAEEPVNFPLPAEHPWTQLVAQARQGRLFDQDTDNEIAAELMTRIIDFEWDAARIEDKLKEAMQLAIWYGTGILLDGYDDMPVNFGEKTGIFVDTIHPRDFYIDTMATSTTDARWMSYVSLKSTEWLKAKFPDKAAEIEKLGSEKKKSGKNVDFEFEILNQFRDVTDRIKDKNHVLEVHFKRDYRMETREVRTPTGDVEPVISEITGMPVLDESTGFPVLKPVEIVEEVSVPKFRGGWRMIMKVGQLVLSDGEITTPNGELPIHVVRGYRVPRQFWGMGVVEQTRHLNFLLDKSLKYAIENANRTAHNKVIVDKGQVADADEVYKNERGGVLTLEAGGNIDAAVKALPAQPLPQAHVSMINLLRELTDNITGITDMRFAENLPKDASGKFLQQAESGANSRLSEMRENLEREIKPLAHNLIAYSIAFEDRSRFLKITGSFGQEPAYVEFNPTILQFQDEDFEARFDVQIGGSELTLNSVFEEDQLSLERIQTLAGLGPDLAAEMLKVLHIPNRKAIEKALGAFFRAQALAAQQAQQDPSSDKVQQDQNEAISQIVRRVGESTADSIENLAKELGDTNPEQADALITQMPDIVAENVARTIQQLSGALSGGQQLTPEQQAELAAQAQQGILPQ